MLVLVWWRRTALLGSQCGLRPPPLVAGPVLAPLRAAGPAAAHTKGPMTEDETPQPPDLIQFDHAVVVRPDRPSPRPVLVTGARHRSRPLPRPCGITLRVSLDR